MIEIKNGLCKGCGECVAVCHESCMTLTGKKITIDYGSCSTCGQCVAICPEQALWWGGNKPEKIDASKLPTEGSMAELLMSRRTNRDLRAEKPNLELINRVIQMGAYAPTHTHNFRAIVVHDDKTIGLIDAEVMKKIKLIYYTLFKPPFIKWILKLMPESYSREFNKGLPKLEHSIKTNKAYNHNIPVLVYLAADKSTPLTLESAQYIIYNMDLYCRTMGLGCRNLTGNNMLINRSSAIKKMLGLKKGEAVFAAATFGYPAKKFRNKVIGREMEIINIK